MDFGAQVTLVRRQMLPKIKEKQGWSIDQCHARNRTIEQQPVGAVANLWEQSQWCL